MDEIIPKGKAYLLKSGNETLLADAVILACGGAAGAKLGGVMDGYRLGKAYRKLPASLVKCISGNRSYWGAAKQPKSGTAGEKQDE